MDTLRTESQPYNKAARCADHQRFVTHRETSHHATCLALDGIIGWGLLVPLWDKKRAGIYYLEYLSL